MSRWIYTHIHFLFVASSAFFFVARCLNACSCIVKKKKKKNVFSMLFAMQLHALRCMSLQSYNLYLPLKYMLKFQFCCSVK